MAGKKEAEAKLKEPFPLPFVKDKSLRILGPIHVRAWRAWWPSVTVNVIGLRSTWSINEEHLRCAVRMFPEKFE